MAAKESGGGDKFGWLEVPLRVSSSPGSSCLSCLISACEHLNLLGAGKCAAKFCQLVN
jgi:hypothetical protein